MIETLEQELDSFDAGCRGRALRQLAALAEEGKVAFRAPGDRVNMHCHTFFSYNSYGYSPSRFAWQSRKEGLALAGIVDFDVLDGLDEFIEAGRLLGLRTCGGLETRVFVPEFADKVMTSPGEPGITYHMGVGFPAGRLTGRLKAFQEALKQTAQQRNRELVQRVNAYLKPAELNYERDVLPLTPAGNATERHICLAYARKAAAAFAGPALERFWSDKLGADAAKLGLPEGRDLLNTIRNKTMKRGGVGYVQPDAGAFPRMAETNAFVLKAGGIATLTWLNGQSEGERDMERLLATAMATGVEAVNIIPDRNFTPGVRDELLVNLNSFITLACAHDLPIVVGTEMNSPGQRFVDQFDKAELKPHVPVFLKGARVVYAHCVLQRRCGLGYSGRWATRHFPRRVDRNRFFERVGMFVDPRAEDRLDGLNDDTLPAEILRRLGA